MYMATHGSKHLRLVLPQGSLQRLISSSLCRTQNSSAGELHILSVLQVGLQGLETGLDKFEPRRGGRLTTAVYWCADS